MKQEEKATEQKPVEYAKPKIDDFGSLFELTAGGFGGPRQDCLFPNRDGWFCGRRRFS